MRIVVPLPAWFRGPLRERAEATFFGRDGGESGLLDTRGLRRLWYEHQLGLRDHSTALWSLLMFETWHRRFQGAGALERPAIVGRPTVIQAGSVGIGDLPV